MGIISAIKNPALIPLDGSIALAVIQCSEIVRTEVPYTVLRNQQDVDRFASLVLSMVQLKYSTNPGDCIVAAARLLTVTYNPNAIQSICLFTDGISNDGVLPADAIVAAKNSAIQLDQFGVIALEDYYSNSTVLQAEYGPLVFGGGSLLVVKDSAELASTVGSVCFPGRAVDLVGMELVQVSQDLLNSAPLIKFKSTLVRTYIQPMNASKSALVQVRTYFYI
jgi:von Willebrand factor type A domain